MQTGNVNLVIGLLIWLYATLISDLPLPEGGGEGSSAVKPSKKTSPGHKLEIGSGKLNKKKFPVDLRDLISESAFLQSFSRQGGVPLKDCLATIHASPATSDFKIALSVNGDIKEIYKLPGEEKYKCLENVTRSMNFLPLVNKEVSKDAILFLTIRW